MDTLPHLLDMYGQLWVLFNFEGRVPLSILRQSHRFFECLSVTCLASAVICVTTLLAHVSVTTCEQFAVIALKMCSHSNSSAGQMIRWFLWIECNSHVILWFECNSHVMSDVHRRFLLDGVHHSRKKSARKRETAARAEHQSRTAPAAPEYQSVREGNDGKRMLITSFCWCHKEKN